MEAASSQQRLYHITEDIVVSAHLEAVKDDAYGGEGTV
jgi:hypothetical protein